MLSPFSARGAHLVDPFDGLVQGDQIADPPVETGGAAQRDIGQPPLQTGIGGGVGVISSRGVW